MEAKFTPGPWRYDFANPSPTTGAHMIAGGKPGYLAEVRDCGSGDVRANARLIAAAPELLEALQMIARMDYGNPYASDCADVAREAILKATGKAA